jgi:preprotein translocase subunit SecF
LASPKIKKRSVSGKASAARRQGAIPCLILIFIVLVLVAVLFFASFAHGATVGLIHAGRL